MIHSRRFRRLGAAVVIGLATAVLAAGAVLAHPESEGAHPGGCVVAVEPGSVGVGGQFTVAGNFGGASIFLVKGANASPAENAQPDATTPAGSSFSVTFTAEAADVGDWTVWGLLPESECGDSDALTVTTLPNTAVPPEPGTVVLGWIALLLGLALVMRRVDGRPIGGQKRSV
jgi:hypothetical protein